MKTMFYSITCCILFVIASGCSDSTKLESKAHKLSTNEQMTVFVTVPPQKSIIQAIAGKYVHIEVMVSPGKEPHDYQPTPKQMLALYSAKAYFEIGIPFEKTLVAKFKKMNIKVNFIDMHKNTKQLVYDINGKTTIDPHIWMSPIQLKTLCFNTLNALIKLMPQHKVYFENNYKVYIEKLDKTHKELKVLLKPFKGNTFFVFHPAFGYFARDFGLNQEAVEIEGKEPTPKEFFNLISKAKRKDIKVIFVEPQFSQKSAQAFAEAIHGSVISINPLSENILDNFLYIAKELKSSFSSPKRNN